MSNTYNLSVHRKLTITVEESVYEGLHRVVGRRRISQFIEELVRPHVVSEALDAGYAALAADADAEREALAWSEATIGDATDPAEPSDDPR